MMKIKTILCSVSAALILNGCTTNQAQNESKSIDNELILRENSGINSQINIGEITKTTDIQSENSDKLNYSEQKGIWLSYIDLNELFYQKSRKEFTEGFEKVCHNCKSIGVNTLYIHVRAFGDAFYDSKLFQKTKTFGDIDYDPFEIMVETAHKNKLSVHAWINPLRCETASEIEKADSSFQISKWYSSNSDILKYNPTDEHYWLDPSYNEVVELICGGVKEIIDNYDVDGIHFDDYFYPTTDECFDEKAFSLSGESDLKEWRTHNIDKLVKAVYETIKSCDKNILFGISPQGNIQNNYEYMYADVGKWCSESGYIDYILPQIYFGFENSVLPFESCADEWSRLVTNERVQLITGLAAYKIYSDDEFIAKTDILSLQISSIRQLENYGGYAFYNYISLFPSDSGKAQAANRQIDSIKKTGGI